MPLVEERWFDDYYRVLVVREDRQITVSADLYAEIPCMSGEELRLGDVSLRYVDAQASCLGLLGAESLVFLILNTGSGERCELIGARLVFRPEARIPVKEIYRALRSSWRRCLGFVNQASQR